MTVTPVRRGRPPLLDATEMQSRAIAVVSRHGFSEVTMAQVATEIGVSLRTLHRYFPSKADLVWGALDDTFVDLRARLADVGDDPGVVEAMATAIASCLDPRAELSASGRERLRLIATTPELQEVQSNAFRQWRETLADYAARRLGASVDDLAPVVLATAIQSATMTGLSWWATHDVSEPAANVVLRAIRALARAGGGD